MKRSILVIAVIALVAVAVFGGQALAAKPTGSSVSIETFEGCFLATDYPTGFTGSILDESYPEVRHVSVTIFASSFDISVDDYAEIYMDLGCTAYLSVDRTSWWEDPTHHYETIEFNTHHWVIFIITAPSSDAVYNYAVTVTYPR